MANVSQLINLSTGSPSDIAHLIADWLGPEPVPIPPTEENPPSAINLGQTETILSDATIVPTTGSAFALPAGGTRLTWQTVFSVIPVSVTIYLQVSLDGAKWATIDESSNILGEIRSKRVNSRFIRAVLNEADEAVSASVKVLVRRERAW